MNAYEVTTGADGKIQSLTRLENGKPTNEVIQVKDFTPAGSAAKPQDNPTQTSPNNPNKTETPLATPADTAKKQPSQSDLPQKPEASQPSGDATKTQATNAANSEKADKFKNPDQHESLQRTAPICLIPC